ncbi:MAG TPA: hypothetical protein VLA89_05570 [Gemmatimonadales bacterium]|nr:hypothetical protein [Gemmatimonadales bacterium]
MTTLTEREYWEDFGRRLISAPPFTEALSAAITKIIFEEPLRDLPVTLRKAVEPIRGARRTVLMRLVPESIKGTAKRGAYLRGIEAAVEGKLETENPYRRSTASPIIKEFQRLWLLGWGTGSQWAQTQR